MPHAFFQKICLGNNQLIFHGLIKMDTENKYFGVAMKSVNIRQTAPANIYAANFFKIVSTTWPRDFTCYMSFVFVITRVPLTFYVCIAVCHLSLLLK